jgi:hypothetical protein
MTFLDSTESVQILWELIEEDKRNCVGIRSYLLEWYRSEGDNGNETWIHHQKPQSKHQSMQWKHPSSPATKKFKIQLSAGKVMLMVFRDSPSTLPGMYNYTNK